MSNIIQVRDENRQWITLPALTGPKGPKGEPGIQGKKGDRGDTVIIGPKYEDLVFPVVVGTYCLYNNLPYKCKTEIPASESWTAAHWESVSFEDEIAAQSAEIVDLKSAINVLDEEINDTEVTDLEPETYLNNWGAHRDGCGKSEIMSFVLKAFEVAPGDILNLVIPKDYTYAGVYLFQSELTTGSITIMQTRDASNPQTNPLMVGNIVDESVDGRVIVPEGAHYLITSCKMTTTITVQKIISASKIDALGNRIGDAENEIEGIKETTGDIEDLTVPASTIIDAINNAQSTGAGAATAVQNLNSKIENIEDVLEIESDGYIIVDSVDEMTDMTKIYVLSSNNHIYRATEEPGVPIDEFGIDRVNWRIYVDSPGGESINGYFTTDKIPFNYTKDANATVTIKNAAHVRDRYDSYNYGSSRCVAYDSQGNRLDAWYLGGRADYSDYFVLLKDGNDLTGGFSTMNASAKDKLDAIKDSIASVAFCWPIETATRTEVPDANLSAITEQQVEAKEYELYFSTHVTTVTVMADTGEIYTPGQSAIDRIDSEISDLNDRCDEIEDEIGDIEKGYALVLTVGAWADNGKTPTSDSNQLRNTQLIPLSKVRKMVIHLPDGLTACNGHGFILDASQNLLGIIPWGDILDFESVSADGVYVNISISARISSGGVTDIAPYKDTIQQNIEIIKATGYDVVNAITQKIGGIVIGNEYILPGVSSAISELRSVQYLAPTALTLAFMTDLHYSRTGKDSNINLIDNLAAIQMVARENVVHGLMMGGDNIAESSTRAAQLLNLVEYGRKVRMYGVPVFSAKGNHDDSSISGWDASAGKSLTGYNIFDSEYYVGTEKPIEAEPNVVFPPDPTGLYYYVDFPANRVRLIVLNSVDIPYVDDGTGHLVYRGQSDYGYSNDQLNWVAHTALDFTDKADPDAWGVVTMQHIIDNPNLGNFSDGLVTHNGVQMYNIFKAFVGRTTYSSISSDTYFPHDVSVDFTNATQEMICRINGHTHADRNAMGDDGLHISTMQAGPNSVGNNAATDGNTYTKTPGTDEESAVDFFTFDRVNKIVYCTRYGAGVSRQFSWVAT